MSRHVVKLPDLGEGTTSSEIVAWKVKVGDRIAEDDPMVEMSTDKSVVELPAPVGGKVVSLGGQPGDQIAVGAELYVLETDAGAAVESSPAAASEKPAAPSCSCWRRMRELLLLKVRRPLLRLNLRQPLQAHPRRRPPLPTMAPSLRCLQRNLQVAE